MEGELGTCEIEVFMGTAVNILLLSPLIALLLYFCIKYPEIPFSIFIFVGYIKGKPWIQDINSYFDITLLFIIITLISLGFNFIRNKDDWLQNIKIDPRLLVPYFFLCFMMLLSFNYTGSPTYGLDKMIRFLTITTLITFLPYFLFWRKGSMERFLLPVVLLAAANGLQILILGSQASIGDIIENYIAIARLGGIALIAALFYLLRLQGKAIRKIFYWAMLPFILVTLLAPGGRGPIIAAVLSVFIVSLYIFIRLPAVKGKNIEISKVFRTELLITLMIFVVIGVSLISVFPQVFGKTEVRMSGLFRSISQDVTFADRMDLYKLALDTMSSFPAALIGLGIGGYNEASGAVDSLKGNYPHNIFLEVGAELGLLSLIVLLYLVIKSIGLALMNINNALTRDGFFLSMTVLVMFIYILINALISGDINDNRTLFLIIGIVFALRNRSMVEGFGEFGKENHIV